MNDTIADFSNGTATDIKKAYPLLILKYTVIYSLSFILGMTVWYVTLPNISLQVKNALAMRFSGILTDCTTFSDRFETVLRCTSSDIHHVILTFIAGFTMFTGIALTSLLIFRGFSFGLSGACLLSLIRESEVAISSLRFGIYLALSALVAASIICFCSKSTIFSDDFRRLGGRRRLIVHSHVLWRQIYDFLLTLGFAVFLGLLNCI